MHTKTMKLRELTVRYSAKKDYEGRPVTIDAPIGSPSDAASLFVRLLQNEPDEVFAILCLTTKHRVIAYHEVSHGTLDSAPAHPREVFKAAILANAAAVILAHNHPSGDPLPSADDCELTRRLLQAGDLLGIHVLDHVIVGDDCYFSFRERGQL
jgi:DNA repair protein RadC